MSFEKLIRIPQDRIGVLIGKSGKTKREVEKRCSVSLQIDSDSGEIFFNGSGTLLIFNHLRRWKLFWP